MTNTHLNNKLIATEIQEHLSQSQSFIDHVVIDDAYAARGPRDKKVAVPQAGTLPDVVIDSTDDLSVVSRTDTYMEYSISSYRTKPILVRNFDEYFTNYDKQQSVTREQASQLKNTFIKKALHIWATQLNSSSSASGRKILSTGANRNASTGTGNRKALTFNDLLSVRKQLVKDGGDQTAGQYFAVLNAELYADLLKLDEVKEGNYRLSAPTLSGAVAEFMGFTFFLREDIPKFASGSTSANLLGFDASGGNTAAVAALFFHRDLVRRALSAEVSIFIETSAGRAGVELSSELFAGASLARTDARGCVLLIEAA